jgi:hypothetical protein
MVCCSLANSGLRRGVPLPCGEIVSATIAMGVEKEDRLVKWFGDAEAAGVCDCLRLSATVCTRVHMPHPCRASQLTAAGQIHSLSEFLTNARSSTSRTRCTSPPSHFSLVHITIVLPPEGSTRRHTQAICRGSRECHVRRAFPSLGQPRGAKGRGG